MLDRGKDPLLLPYTYISFSSTVDLLLHLQYYQRCKSKTFRIWGNVNVFRDNQVIIIYLLIERIGKLRFWGTHFSENTLLLWVSRNSLQTPSLVDLILGNFILRNSTLLVEDLIRWKRCFEIFLIDHCASDIGNKNIAGKYQNILVSVSSTIYWAHQFTQVTTSIIPWSM